MDASKAVVGDREHGAVLDAPQRAAHGRGCQARMEQDGLLDRGQLPVGALVYVGRAGPQQESAAYGGQKYGGGSFQFRLSQSPEIAFTTMKRYAAV